MLTQVVIERGCAAFLHANDEKVGRVLSSFCPSLLDEFGIMGCEDGAIGLMEDISGAFWLS